MEATCSPIPWRTDGHPGDDSGTAWRSIVTDGLAFSPSYVGQMTEADAEFACRAVNCHEALLTALKEAETVIRWAAQEAAGRVKAEIVGGWLHHANRVLRAALARERLEYLRVELRAERISYGELAELQSLAEYIEPGDVELLEAAGVPESE